MSHVTLLYMTGMPQTLCLDHAQEPPGSGLGLDVHLQRGG